MTLTFISAVSSVDGSDECAENRLYIDIVFFCLFARIGGNTNEEIFIHLFQFLKKKTESNDVRSRLRRFRTKRDSVGSGRQTKQ